MIELSQQTFSDYCKLCEERWGIKIVEKKTSLLMKAIALVLFFNKKFMTGYITTIGTTIYWPDAKDLRGGDFRTLFHEAQHGYDYKRSPVWFIMTYLSPQIVAILSLLAFLAILGNILWSASLLFLLLLAPLPSIGRTYWEVRGYSCGMALDIWKHDEVSQRNTDFVIDRFVCSDYYFMWPFKKSMKRKLAKAERNIRAGKLTEVQQVTYDFLLGRSANG